MNTGAMSVYSSLYCRLLTRMTHCWFAPLTGIFHLHPCGTNQMSQVLWVRPLPLTSTFTSSPRKNSGCVCVAKEIFRGNVSPVHSLSKLYLKNKRGIKPLILRPLCFCLVHPTVQKHHGYSCSAAPRSPLCLWPCWPDVPTMAPVGTAVHGSVLRIEKPDSLTWRFRTQTTILLEQLYTFQVILLLKPLLFFCGTIEVTVKMLHCTKTESSISWSQAISKDTYVIMLVLLRPYQSFHSSRVIRLLTGVYSSTALKPP